MKKILFLTLFLNWVAIMAAQPTYSKSIDLESDANNGFSIKVVDDGYIILAGSADISSPTEYISIVHTDFEGEMIWQKHYKNEPWKLIPPSAFSNAGIQIDGGGNLYISGNIEPNGNQQDVFLMKTDMNGDSVWMRIYGGMFKDFNTVVQFHTDSTLLLLSAFTLSNTVNDDTIWLIETDKEGNMLWEKKLDGGYVNTAARDLLVLDNEEFLISYLTCETKGICEPGSERTLAITRFGRFGEEVWTVDVAYDEDGYEAPPLWKYWIMAMYWFLFTA